MKRFIIVLFLLLVLSVWSMPLDVSVGIATPLYLIRGNVFADFFKEPIEILVFIAYSGKSYAFTNQKESSVTMIYEEFEDILEEDGLETKDLMCVIHNHIGNNPKFSPRDIQFYNSLREKGFKGLFLLWSSPRQCVTDMRYAGGTF